MAKKKKKTKASKKANKSAKRVKATTKKGAKSAKKSVKSKKGTKPASKTKKVSRGAKSKKAKSGKKSLKKSTKKVKTTKTSKKTKKEAKSVKKKEVPPEDDEIRIIKVESSPGEEEATGKEQKIVIDLSEDENEEIEEEVEDVEKGERRKSVEELLGKAESGGAENEEKTVSPGKPRCPECGSTNLRWDYEKAELVCLDCGAIIEESLIDFGPEWRAFDSYQKAKRQRTGSPIKYTKPNKGLVTEIDKYNRDIRGSKLSPQAASQMGRLRKWHKRSSIASSIERNLTIAMGDLERISSYLGLPSNIREAAALLYRKAVEKGLIRGRLIESVVAAVIYMICRQYGIPRTLDEISEVSGITKKEIGRTYRFLKKELYVDVPLTNPIYYVPRFASALGLSGKVQEKAKEILNEAVEKGLISGRGPTGVAAAAVYIASVMMGERRTQKEVAEVAGVTEVTIRNRYRELKRELNIDIDEE
uniref:Transcription initiation factor IIB n=1 Tax=uncultured euryarchaeote Alv-FOS5 TaxID=337891 RepID=Q3SBA6_9EURY|nr:archaeal transcriptional initiation factor TFB [uncultured euryarchaeote Alv-FOS5]